MNRLIESVWNVYLIVTLSIKEIMTIQERTVLTQNTTLASDTLDVEEYLYEIVPISTWRRPDTVRRFLVRHPYLLELLPDAFRHVRRLFGADTPIELDITTDPEGTGPDVLFAYIVTSRPVDEALVLLNQLDEQWYLLQPVDVLEIFNFNLHFV